MEKIYMVIFIIALYTAIFFWIREKHGLITFFVIISSIHYFEVITSLLDIIRDIRENRVKTENLYIGYVGERKFEIGLVKKYYYIECCMVKGKKYTDKIIYLNASKDFQLQEKTIVKIEYYEKSKIVKEIK